MSDYCEYCNGELDKNLVCIKCGHDNSKKISNEEINKEDLDKHIEDEEQDLLK